MKNRIAHSLFLILPLFVLSACEESGKEENRPDGERTNIESPHFVSAYADVIGIKADRYRYLSSFDENRAIFSISFDLGYDQIWAPEIEAYYPYTEEERSRYMALAERYGDLAYQGSWTTEFPNVCPAEPFRSIHAVCRNRDLGDDHPAGTSLDDIMEAELLSYRDYIRGGYKPFFVEGEDGRCWYEEFNIIKKYLTDLTADDLQLFDVDIRSNNEIHLYIDPGYLTAPGDYEFIVTMVTESGRSLEAEYTLTLSINAE